jgi:serine/threonine protein kinase
LSDIFRGFLENPEPLDDDGRRLLNSLQRLKAPSIAHGIPNSPPVEWVLDEIGCGDSSVVKLSCDLKGELSAVKTSRTPNHAELIRREAAILKTLKHPLILELHDILETPAHKAAIVTEFEGNGSLADHLPPAKCCLSGANRIAKVVSGIALAMRFVHSRGIIHRDLKPANILLDWDWTVRIADFGHSTSPDNPHSPSVTGGNPDRTWPSIDSRYLAPECYENLCFPESDVFSFGLILYELLTGQTAFPIQHTQHKIAFKIINEELPDIPESVLPPAAKLITDCWATEPDDRPSFEEIVARLKEIKLKVTSKVNSAKVFKFVNEIEECEKRIEPISILQLSLVC